MRKKYLTPEAEVTWVTFERNMMDSTLSTSTSPHDPDMDMEEYDEPVTWTY